jgi:hypothetical protein
LSIANSELAELNLIPVGVIDKINYIQEYAEVGCGSLPPDEIGSLPAEAGSEI